MSDPYVAEATNTKLTPQQKIDGLKEILEITKTGMLTTRGTNGELHSRAMAPASLDGLHFTFIVNNASHKTDEIEADPHVNVSFFVPGSNHWVSVAGTAKVIQDKKRAKELWSPFVKAWFGDLGDGVHKGDENDPRVSVIDVTPTEIRYWYSTRTKVGAAVEVATSTITGKVAHPGELRTITPQELSLVEGLHMPGKH
ncbi:blue-light-inducible Bli-3-like protein [Rhizoctonia solani AG-3 Rhs1AP]|uniref:Blue-light-inducible Bli-3-like protein n=1 Tax=Rhizoctonia solani AG-3 Rhs1AP TaxID=1086054 RepID=X8JTC6_9AGAM|nr:blue-light-inducible Bli-3-like protein [Rhizoctonia solani AG-3 Rhs1AP]